VLNERKMDKIRPKLRLILLFLQILLPFALYLALNRGNRPLEALIGILLGLSMLTLILIG